VSDDLRASIRRRPAVHRLTYGAFWIDEKTLVIPLAPLGFDHAAAYACHYQQELLGMAVQPETAAAIAAQGRDALSYLRYTISGASIPNSVFERLSCHFLIRA
jgi:hypothetical protein